MNIENISSSGATVGGGFFSGALIGLAKKALKILALLIGSSFAVLAYMRHTKEPLRYVPLGSTYTETKYFNHRNRHMPRNTSQTFFLVFPSDGRSKWTILTGNVHHICIVRTSGWLESE